jgi:hypothetical protein
MVSLISLRDLNLLNEAGAATSGTVRLLGRDLAGLDERALARGQYDSAAVRTLLDAAGAEGKPAAPRRAARAKPVTTDVDDQEISV